MGLPLTRQDDDKGQGPYLVNLPAPPPYRLYYEIPIMKAVDSGCARVPYTDHPFCVADLFYSVRENQDLHYVGAQRVVGFTQPPLGLTPQLLEAKEMQQVGPAFFPSGNFTLFLASGCLPNTNTLCFPAVMSETFISAFGDLENDGWIRVVHKDSVQVKGYRVGGVGAAVEQSVLYRFKDLRGWTMGMMKPATAAKFLFHDTGCGTSKLVCVGQTVQLKSSLRTKDFTIVGYNENADTVIGTYDEYSQKTWMIAPASDLQI